MRCLLDDTLPPDEVLRAFGIFCHEVPLGGEVLAFVYRSRKGDYHIFVSLFLSPEARQEVFLHEIHHIVVDMPRTGYIVGLDMYRHEIEISADEFIKEALALAYTASK